MDGALMQYADLVIALGNLLQYPIVAPATAAPSSDADFNTILPRLIDDAEQRIYREIDFLATYDQDSSLSATVGSRNFTLPSGIIVLESLTAIQNGVRYPLEMVSLDVINMLWPQESAVDRPKYYAQRTNSVIHLGPTPDAAYAMECYGTFRPDPMSVGNPATYLGDNYPDLLLAACMVFGAAFQRDFGAQSSDPQMAVSWESTYQERKASAVSEDKRRKT